MPREEAHGKPEAEVEGELLKVEGHLGLPEAGRGKEELLLRDVGGIWPTP